MNKNYLKIIKALGKDRIRLNEPMAKHTTFKIGGPTDLFYEAKTEKEFVEAIKIVGGSGVPYFILGNGSNLLASDKGFRGIVIKNKNEKIKIEKLNGIFRVSVSAGFDLQKFLNSLAENSISGLEFMAGIPGSVGGAIRGNAGAWQRLIGDRVSKMKVLTENGEIRWLNKKNCQFSYRNSRFKKTKEIILEAEFELESMRKEEIENRLKEFLIKRKNQPKEASVGCIFINPPSEPAGKLIDESGLKGQRIGNAQISPKHANFIVNLGRAKAADVVALITLARLKVKEKFGIDLEEEIVRLGEF